MRVNRKISVRRDGICAECGVAIPTGNQAWWDPTGRRLICLSHTDSQPLDSSEVSEKPPTGPAGGSALAMSAKFRARDAIKNDYNRERFEFSHPFLSRYITPKEKFSHQTRVWSKGAVGEIEVGKILNDLGEKYGFIAIHDRLMPKSRANIDHMAVTSSGVFIVDAKNYQGTIEVRGRLEAAFGGSSQLWIGRRNRTSLIEGVNKQILAIEGVLGREGVQFPVFGALAFYKAKWDLPKHLRPNSVNGILINSKGLEHIFEKLPPNDSVQIAEIAELLLSKLPPAT